MSLPSARRVLFYFGFLALAACANGCASDTSDDDDMPLVDGSNDDSSALTSDWAPIGTGVAYKNTGDGPGVWIGYAGYSVKDTWSCAWTTELHRVRLKNLGIGHLYCVRGPQDAGYNAKEIGNSKLAAHLVAGPAQDAPFIFIAAHSSGHYVAEELFGQLFSTSHSLDPSGVTKGKIVYADLDGGSSGLSTHLVGLMKHISFFYGQDSTLSSGLSANAGVMQNAGSEYDSPAVKLKVDHSGCHSGAKWCLHDLLITTKPHNPNTFDLGDDYTDFAGRPIQIGYIDALAPYLQGAQQ